MTFVSSRELLPSILQSPCSSGPSTSTVVPSAGSSSSSSSVHGLNFSLAAAKALLATQQQSQQHKFGAGSSALQHAGPSSVASGSVAAMDASPEHLEAEPLDTGDEEGVLDSSSSAGPGALLEVHPAGAVPLYGNVFVTERGEVALVSSTGQDSEDLLEVSGLARICVCGGYINIARGKRSGKSVVPLLKSSSSVQLLQQLVFLGHCYDLSINCFVAMKTSNAMTGAS